MGKQKNCLCLTNALHNLVNLVNALKALFSKRLKFLTGEVLLISENFSNHKIKLLFTIYFVHLNIFDFC